MVIKDKILKPYEIHSSANGYSVEKKSKNAKKEKVLINQGYFSNVESCLLKIVRLKADKLKTVTLKAYVKEYKALVSEIKNCFKTK